jgi:hypothetical protein
MQGAHNLIIYPNAAYARAFGPVSCTRTRVCKRLCTYVCVRVCVCVRCVRTCVHALCTCARVCVRVRVHVRARMFVCMHAHVKGLKVPFLLVSSQPPCLC